MSCNFFRFNLNKLNDSISKRQLNRGDEMHELQLKLTRNPVENSDEFEDFLSVTQVICHSPPQGGRPQAGSALGLGGKHFYLWMYTWENESSPLLLPHPTIN